jgi:hypothetical protein
MIDDVCRHYAEWKKAEMASRLATNPADSAAYHRIAEGWKDLVTTRLRGAHHCAGPDDGFPDWTACNDIPGDPAPSSSV